MTYRALYRTWRPQRFLDVIGQDVITQTLKNSIITDQISHAYLFTGPRGTGKTSAAKIFAKAVNCPFQKNGEPCNECSICRAITKSQLNDVVEIDAASNNGVEEIRDIRDKVKYAPTQAKYKVYIIDEVHMLSAGAFNALLKTLEEPPANVIFILATTEFYKIPTTIISRVQQFNFRRISAKDSVNHMEKILSLKEISYEEQALWVIARAAEGGMRDALSILDQVLSFNGDKVTLDDVLLITGSVTGNLLKEYFLQVANGESAAALVTVSKIMAAGKSGQRFIEDLISFIRNLLLYRESPDLVTAVEAGLRSEEFRELSTVAKTSKLYKMIDTLDDIQEKMRFATHLDVYLEILTVRLCQRDSLAEREATTDTKMIAKLEAEVKQLYQQMVSLGSARPLTSPPASLAQSSALTEVSRVRNADLTHIYSILESATRQDLENLKKIWNKVLLTMDTAEKALINTSEPVAASPRGIIVAFDGEFLFQQAKKGNLVDKMSSYFQHLTGNGRQVIFVLKGDWSNIRQDFLMKHGYSKKLLEPKEQTILTEKTAMVEQAKKLFGANVVEIRND